MSFCNAVPDKPFHWCSGFGVQGSGIYAAFSEGMSEAFSSMASISLLTPLNGLEKKLEARLPESERRWPIDDSKGS